MKVCELIEALMTLDLELEVGATNYYGEFGPACGVTVEKATPGGFYRDNANVKDGQPVAVIDLALDMQ